MRRALLGGIAVDLNARKNMPLLSIRVVQKLTGLSARQIRYYEERGLVVPERSEGNQRLFSFHDAERLLEIRALLDRGLNIAGVQAYFEKEEAGARTKREEPTDGDLYRRIQSQLMNRSSTGGTSEFQGDLSRFYRPKS
jgi:MerR family transcriptional regulator, glutamine synthetase repressor